MEPMRVVPSVSLVEILKPLGTGKYHFCEDQDMHFGVQLPLIFELLI